MRKATGPALNQACIIRRMTPGGGEPMRWMRRLKRVVRRVTDTRLVSTPWRVSARSTRGVRFLYTIKLIHAAMSPNAASMWKRRKCAAARLTRLFQPTSRCLVHPLVQTPYCPLSACGREARRGLEACLPTPISASAVPSTTVPAPTVATPAVPGPAAPARAVVAPAALPPAAVSAAGPAAGPAPCPVPLLGAVHGHVVVRAEHVLTRQRHGACVCV